MEYIVSKALDHKDHHRELTSLLISDLYGKILCHDDVIDGFDDVLGKLSDLTIDTPEAATVSLKFNIQIIFIYNILWCFHFIFGHNCCHGWFHIRISPSVMIQILKYQYKQCILRLGVGCLDTCYFLLITWVGWGVMLSTFILNKSVHYKAGSRGSIYPGVFRTTKTLEKYFCLFQIVGKFIARAVADDCLPPRYIAKYKGTIETLTK